MKGLTEKQRDILEYVETFINTHRYSPSLREIGQHFGYASINSVHKHIQRLIQKGALTSHQNSSRSLSLNTQNDRAPDNKIPIVGELKQGCRIHTFPKIEDYVTHPENRLSDCYALIIKGDFLKENGILDKDLLLVETSKKPSPGEWVILQLNHDENAIKKIFFDGNFCRLEDMHSPSMTLPFDSILIIAVVTHLFRQYII